MSERQHLPVCGIFGRHAAFRHYREGMLHLRIFVRGERREEAPNRHPAGDGLEAGLMVVVRMGGDDPIQPRHAEGFQRGLDGGFLRVSARVNHPGVAIADENGGIGEGHLGKSNGEDGGVGRKAGVGVVGAEVEDRDIRQRGGRENQEDQENRN